MIPMVLGTTSFIGRIQSLLVPCKLHGINPYTYLVDEIGNDQNSCTKQKSAYHWYLCPRQIIKYS